MSDSKMTLDKFEEAYEDVKKVTLETKLIYSDYWSGVTGNKVYLKPENLQRTAGAALETMLHGVPEPFPSGEDFRTRSRPAPEIFPARASSQCAQEQRRGAPSEPQTAGKDQFPAERTGKSAKGV